VPMSQRMPTAFVPHAGGPTGHVEMGLNPAEAAAFVAYWTSLPKLLPSPPTAVLVVSAHWLCPVATVMTSPRPPMFYDYGGFPAEAYRIQWPVPGSPTLAARVRALLGEAGIPSAEDPARGYDHGTFVPLKFAFPSGVPVVQLSLVAGLDPELHHRIGRALATLRDEGVFIAGSGDSFHNMRGFDPTYRELADKFDTWLGAVVAGAPAERAGRLAQWASAPAARQCHPFEDHLLPLMVVAGAAHEEPGAVTWTGTFLGPRQTGYHFGAVGAGQGFG
jgi:aromatic ring-opening dioxygenase catalytic subunit (LigB family)